MYKCIIIDDEEHSILGLKRYISAVPTLELIDCFTDPQIALSAFKKIDQVDLVLLDVDMPIINGIELSAEIRRKTNKLVFTTGYTKYGYEAFKAGVDDYLLKPYTLGEFIICIDKLFTGYENESRKIDQAGFLVKSKEDNNKIISVKFNSIIAVESKLNYVTIYTTTRKITTYMSLTEMFSILSQAEIFLQFHRSFIVSYDHIEFISGNTIRMSNGIEITVRDYYRKSFSDFVSKYLIKASRVNKPADY